MVQFGKKVVKYRALILIVSLLLLIPSVLGYVNTRVNYDVLTYLPEDIETMKGQDIMVRISEQERSPCLSRMAWRIRML